MVQIQAGGSFVERYSGGNIPGDLFTDGIERNGPTTSFSQIIEPSQDELKLAIIQKLRAEHRLHYRTMNFEIVRRLSAYLMFTPEMAEDLRSAIDEGREIPKEIRFLLEDSVHVNGGIMDNRILLAFRHLHPSPINNRDPIYLLLSAYLGLACKVSVHPKFDANGKSKSFLEAAHDNGFLVDRDKPVPTNLRECLINTLKDLGLWDFPEIKAFVDDWCQYGTFKVDGELHSQDSKGNVEGVYTKMTNLICRLHNTDFAEINSVIAFALKIKDDFKQFANLPNPDKAAHDYLDNLIRRFPDSRPEIEKIIEEGNKMRFDGLCTEVLDHFANRNMLQFPFTVEGENFLNDVLTGLPLETLQVMDQEHIRLAYAHWSNISGLYPSKVLPALDKYDCDITRFSSGVMVGQFHTIMVSDGNPAKLENQPNAANFLTEWQFNVLKCREMVAHETVHLILNRDSILYDTYLSGQVLFGDHWGPPPIGEHTHASRIGQMKDRLIEICYRLQTPECQAFLNEYSILDPNLTIGRILSPEVISGVKYDKNLWPEEVMANLWALLQGEQSLKHRPYGNLLHSVGGDEENVPQAIRDLREYCRDLKIMMGDLCENITQAHYKSHSERLAVSLEQDEGQMVA